MTKKEMQLIEKAVHLFSADGNDWEGGMRILLGFLGRTLPQDRLLKTAKMIPVFPASKEAAEGK